MDVLSECLGYLQRVGHTFSKSKKLSKHAADLSAALEATERANIVINAISDGIAIINDKGIISLFNPAASEMTGWAMSDAVNLDFRSIFKFFDITEHPIPDDLNVIICAVRSNNPTQQNDVFLQTASKKYVRVSVKVTPFGKSNNGGVVVIFRDITAEKREGGQQSDFISTASHEMRTPIAIIEGYIGMLLNPATATIDSRAKVYAQKAHEASQHLGRLFQDLLDVTKVDDGHVRGNPILVDAGAAVRQVVEQISVQANKKGLELKYDSVGEIQPLYIIYVDIDQFQEILENILDNAIKYTKQGSIKVSVTENQGKVHISIIDTGIGIPAEDVPHLFQKFYRVDNSDTREVGGTGLGLYLIKNLTDRLGGQIGVDSDYGKGSTFWVEFDILTREQAIAKAHEIKARRGATAGRS
ncbi:ATP-binding protein [Candidatus Saccharibacteria bacterium]|nr:ATP-binding protein [Candidatus Saccharibacteria bacterium]